MNSKNQLCVKLIHCGNRNIANPDDYLEKSIFFMPMGLFSMANILKQRGVDAEIIHLDLEHTRNIEKILDFNTLDAVGLDCHWANQGMVVIDTAKVIKKIKPTLFIFLGGYTASFFAHEILNDYPEVDAVIRGDGEIPLLQLCHSLYKHKSQLEKNQIPPHEQKNTAALPLKGVENLTWKEKNKEIIANRFSYVSTSKEMNQWDFAAVDLLRNWKYYRNLCRYWTKFKPICSLPLFMLEIGRGCTYTCTTCGGNARAQEHLSNRKGQVFRSTEAVISSIKKALHFGFTCFLACFEFRGSDMWYQRLFAKIKQEKLKIHFIYESWGLPSKILIDTLSHGCEQALITISPETANPDLRRKNKGNRQFYTNHQLEQCLEYINSKNNLNAQLYFGYFLPHDTETAVFKTMNYITHLFSRYGDFVEFFYLNFNTDPGSSLYLNPEKYKMISTVCTFDHYIGKLKNYVAVNGERPGKTLLSWPGAMTENEAVHLANKILLFNHLFFFNRSISYLLKKVGKANIISAYLKKLNLSNAQEMAPKADKIKNMLSDIAKIHLAFDNEMMHLIAKEYQDLLSSYSFKENLASFYTCENQEKKSSPPEEANEILFTIKKDRDEISVGFTLE